MERAIFITKVNQLRYVNDRYVRLYFGNEFCERLIPSISSLEQLLSYVKKRKLAFSLVTPYVTNDGFKKLEGVFGLLKSARINCEAIINDWGVLNLVNYKYPNLTPVLGRLLTKQKRCPSLIKMLKRDTRPRLIQDYQNPNKRLIIIQKKLPITLDSYYKGSNVSNVPIIHDFLINQRIKRIELDNLGQGLSLELPKNEISASIYLPYIYISTTFFCPTAGCEQKNRFLLKINPCKRECQRYVFKLRHKTFPKLIYLKGNTQFYKNTRFQVKEWRRLGVDRIVHEPEIPI